MGGEAFQSLVSKTLSLSSKPGGQIIEDLYIHEEVRRWVVNFRRRLFAWEEDDFERMESQLQQLPSLIHERGDISAMFSISISVHVTGWRVGGQRLRFFIYYGKMLSPKNSILCLVSLEWEESRCLIRWPGLG